MKHITSFICLVMTLLFSSCGEDRTHEYYDLIQRQTWIKSVMDKYYLWYEDIPELTEEDYFKDVNSFFQSLLSKTALDGKGDQYSYLTDLSQPKAEARGLDHESTYGMEFMLFVDPLQVSSHVFARVLYVAPESPAAQAGIQRGDWLSAIDKEKFNSSNGEKLINGGPISLAREEIISENGELAWKSVDTVQVAASRHMEVSPFFINKTFLADGKKIAYLMYNEFSTGPLDGETETEYNDQMIQIFQNFKAQAPDAFILDLRYNLGGYVHCAQLLGSLLAPSSALGKNFFTLRYNDQQETQTVDYPLLTSAANANLNLSKIYILVGIHTASASEIIINCLRPYMGEENVILIGSPTEGKNVAMDIIKNNEYQFILYPVTSYVENAEGFSDYSKGFTPDYLIEEYSQLYWGELGNPNEELLLNSAMRLILTGSLPDASTPQPEPQKALFNSLDMRSLKGNLTKEHIEQTNF